MSERYFTKDHEWIAVEGDFGTVGITDYAQKALGDIVYAELPQPGDEIVKGSEAGVVESVKAASDVFTPVTGEVVAINQAIIDQPGLINESPEGLAWFFKIRFQDKGELEGLMDRAAYDSYLAELE